jgi:hypothetical protein
VRGVIALFNRTVAQQVEHQLGQHLVHVLHLEVHTLRRGGEGPA